MHTSPARKLSYVSVLRRDSAMPSREACLLIDQGVGRRAENRGAAGYAASRCRLGITMAAWQHRSFVGSVPDVSVRTSQTLCIHEDTQAPMSGLLISFTQGPKRHTTDSSLPRWFASRLECMQRVDREPPGRSAPEGRKVRSTYLSSDEACISWHVFDTELGSTS